MSPKPLLLHPKWISASPSLLTRRYGAGQHYQVAVCLALAAPGLWNAVEAGSAQGCQHSKPTVLTGWGRRRVSVQEHLLAARLGLWDQLLCFASCAV